MPENIKELSEFYFEIQQKKLICKRWISRTSPEDPPADDDVLRTAAMPSIMDSPPN